MSVNSNFVFQERVFVHIIYPYCLILRKCWMKFFEIYEEVMKVVDRAIRVGTVLDQLDGPALASIFANVGHRSGGASMSQSGTKS